MEDYELDDEGYAKVIFIDLNGTIVEEDDSPVEEDSLYDQEGYAIVEFISRNSQNVTTFFVPPKYIKLADSGKLTKDVLLDMEYADILRLATYKPASRIIKDLFGVRGVHLKNYHKNSTGAIKPTTIKPHQVKALTWMKQREESPTTKTHGIRGGILRLKMGLGKTLTAAIHILSSPKGEFPSLIVCSKTVMINWKKDLEKFFGKGDPTAPKILYLHKIFMSAKELSNITRKVILKYDVVITSYDTCLTACKKQNYQEQCFEMGDEHTLMKGKIVSVHERQLHQANLPNVTGIEVIYGTPWERVVCDESQTFANPDTQKYKCMMAVYGKYKWCLTGTPIRNYETDIWAQLRFCGYNGVTVANEWKKKGSKKFEEHKLVEAIFSMDYKDAGEKLPPKTKYLINATLTGNQLKAYEFVLGETRNAYDMMMQNLCSFSCVLAMFTRLRQCAIAPYLITAESKREKRGKGDKEALSLIKSMMENKNVKDLGAWCHDRDGEAGIYSAKMTKIIDTISKLPKDSKVLIFSSFTSCLDLLAYALEVRLPDFYFVQIDGSTKGEERDRLLDQFNDDSSIRGALFTYKVGGEGLNLTVANHTICIEPWWTPAVHSQAEARCWRIGQTKPVHIHDIIVQDSIEDRIVSICNDKEAMASSYLEGTERHVEKMGRLDKYTLGRMLGIRN